MIESGQKAVILKIKLHGHTLDTVDASKYLGVTISNNLTWDRHIDNTIGKGNKTLGFIRRNLKDGIKPLKSTAYTSMVRPTMEYASSEWNPTNRKKYKKEQQDSFSTITQTEHLAVLLKW